MGMTDSKAGVLPGSRHRSVLIGANGSGQTPLVPALAASVGEAALS